MPNPLTRTLRAYAADARFGRPVPADPQALRRGSASATPSATSTGALRKAAPWC